MPTLAKSLERSRKRASYRYHRSLTNASSRRSFRAHLPALGDVQERALEGLRRHGVAIVSFSELVGDDNLWRALATEVDSFAADAAQRIPRGGSAHRKEDFIIRANGKRASLAPDGAWLRYAASSPLLEVVNAYLGLWSKLTYVDQWYTAPVPPDADRVGSQRWHRDHIDRNIVKVFTYFSDVDRDAGALEYVRGSAAGGRHDHLWPWKPLSGENYPPNDELETQVPEDDRIAAEGTRGTIVLVDTGGFHRGGFAVNPRITSIFTYVSPAAVATPLTNRRFSLEGPPEGLSPQARFAVT